MRVGSEDRSVSPWFTRRMLRVLGETCGSSVGGIVREKLNFYQKNQELLSSNKGDVSASASVTASGDVESETPETFKIK